ncbi:MAG: 2-C-methyl-D-erythritol 4-phosphate cytidylyltransferase, partial [Lachnospiraceae bacterium]|nr:2-C-methyl-D-erythritol 4-phosphate cytidylyltransferase [Lachnospiraceae bacterium]
MMDTNKASGKDKCTALMLAAGLGLRMGADVPKQYLMLDGTPMFLFSIRAMQDKPCITDIIVMVFEGEVEYVRDLLE